MSSTVDFGIDLGTTNSVIARYKAGKVEIFKNPVGHKETLPSVVAFRRERTIIGDKAKEYLEKDPENVIGSFKRRMGTSESFFVPNAGEFKSPVDLSALVLKELKNFVYTGEALEATVITIPASFDTIQSNATKKAGYLAGFREVLLLQEPIAASLAYANKEDGEKDKEGQWLVYDLGGGTFDVALVRIADNEMKVVDHEGDNFLGGLDFDNRIVDRIIIPYLEKQGHFPDLERELKSAKGKYNRLYYELLNKAEEVKVQLTGNVIADIEFETEDMNGTRVEVYLPVRREQFEEAIRDLVESTLGMIETILSRNGLTGSDLNYVLMIGGSTYIPLVRKTIGERFGIPVNCAIDPTTAVAVGAAYYAGSRASTPAEKKQDTLQPVGASPVSVRVAYQKASQDAEEYFAAAVDGPVDGLFYRITRDDGGFDSGLKKLSGRISEMLPLVANAANSFSFRIVDVQNNPVPCNVQAIMIVHGKFNVPGQPLPNYLCLDVDYYEKNTTRLEDVFEKNALLPLKRTITRTITKTVRKGSADSITLNVVEGTHASLPSTNPSIGVIRIAGKELNRDLLKGTDIEITLEMSESRDLRITTYLMMTDQEFSNLFSPSERHVDVGRLQEEMANMRRKIDAEIRSAEAREDYDVAQKLVGLQSEAAEAEEELLLMVNDDITDRKYQAEDRKRKLARQVDALTRDKHIVEAVQKYYEDKRYCVSVVEEYGNEEEKNRLAELIAREKSVMASNSAIRVKNATDAFWKLIWPIRWRTPEHLIRLFYYFAMHRNYPDQKEADEWVKKGQGAIAAKNYDELRTVIDSLHALLPPEQKSFDLIGTGIG